MRQYKPLIAVLLFALCSNFAFAFSDVKGGNSLLDPLLYIKISAAILLFGTVIALQSAIKLNENLKKIVFALIVGPALISSLYLGGHTIYENSISATKGPVHWHADYQVWLCNERIDLIDPKGLLNNVGIPLLHEHNDDRMHIEGTVMDLQHVSLGSYFDAIGGTLSDSEISYKGNDKLHVYKNGDKCPGEVVEGTLQVYVNGKKEQNPSRYVLAPHSQVPPGDCIIFEFDSQDSPTTQRICESWEYKGKQYDLTGVQDNPSMPAIQNTAMPGNTVQSGDSLGS